jgi:16S rRNA (cytosine1402-N4)-methyltransferase
MSDPNYHTPVLLKETLEFLRPKPGMTIVDLTAGGGGHSAAILERLKGKGRLVAVDRDGEAVGELKERLSPYKEQVEIVRDNFKNLKAILKKLKIKTVDGILIDLGVSSHQIDSADRGFSLRREGPLDMRMDSEQALGAKDIVNFYSEEEIGKIIKEFGEEPLYKRIARQIIKARDKKEIETTAELAQAIKLIGRLPPERMLSALTRTFQALRIAVNDELNNLSKALKDSVDALHKNGRIVVISYHSLEDRIVKSTFRQEALDCICAKESPVCMCSHKKRIRVLTKKPVTPDICEVKLNPRSRSAKLRAAERV